MGRLIGDWSDLTELETAKRGPAMKNRRVGDAEKYIRLVGREHLKAWSEVFQGHVETPLLQSSSQCVLLEILSVLPGK